MRRIVPLVIGVMAALVAGLAWAISSPPGSSPDEDFHLASIWCPPPVESSGCALNQDPAKGTLIVIDRRVFANSICYAYHSEVSGSCIWAEVRGGLGATDRYDTSEYPGGYFHVMHLFAGSSDPHRDIYIMRGVNVALAVGLGTAVILFAGRPTRRILAYAVASTYVPMGMFITASVNPSGWALTGVTTFAFALHSYWLSDSRARMWVNGLLAAIGAGMAASARSDAALYVLLTAIALTVLHHRRVRAHLMRLVLPLAAVVLGVLAFLTGSQTTAALNGSGFGLQEGASKPWTEGLSANILALPSLLMGNTGTWGLGWLDTPIPSLASSSMIIVGAFILMAGLSRLPLMKTLVFIGGLIVLVALPLYLLQTAHVQVGNQIQPRYLLPLLPVLVLVLLTGVTPDHAVRLPRRIAWLSWAMVSLANSLSLLVNIQRYTTGVDGPILPGRIIEWWTPGVPGPRATWVIGSVAFAIVCWWLVRLTTARDTLPVTVPESQIDEPGGVSLPAPLSEPSVTPDDHGTSRRAETTSPRSASMQTAESSTPVTAPQPQERT